MKNTGKQVVGLIICLLLIGVTAGAGNALGIFKNFADALVINMNWQVFFRVLVMIFFVLAVEKAIVILMSLVKSEKHRTATISTIIRSVARYGSAIVMLCWGLSIMGVDITTIRASVGIIALIVGFGAESLIEDVITGFFMLFENQYNVGDIVEVDGFRGTVTDISIRTTSITDAGGNVKIINNSNMKDILNRSDNFSHAVTDIRISYDTDLEKFEKKLPAILESVKNAHPDVFKTNPRYLGVSKLADSGVELRFAAEVAEEDSYTAQRILNRDLYIAFKKENVEIPFPQLDVHTK